MVMVDSGNQISNGRVEYYDVYKTMVDVALARPALAEIQAHWLRTGNKVEFYVQVQNLSTVTLSAANSAFVHAIVYEDTHVKATDRFGREAVATAISGLAPNATATFKLETRDLNEVNWDKLHFIVLVDYRPAGSSGAYDTLQAVEALPITNPFTVQPGSLALMVDPTDTTIPPVPLNIQGPDSTSWTAETSASWLAVVPSGGAVPSQPAIVVSKDALAVGWQQGSVTFTTTDGIFSGQVAVSAYLGPVKRLYLPFAARKPAND